MGGRPRLRCAPEVRQGAEAGVQRGEPRRGDQGEGGRERRGGEEVHRRGRQAPEEVPGAPGGEGGNAPGGEGLRPRAHEVGEGCRRQERALSEFGYECRKSKPSSSSSFAVLWSSRG